MSTLGRPAKGLIKLLPNLDLSGSADDLTVHVIAHQERVSANYVYRLLRLPTLAPDIITAIINGKNPPQLTAKKLMRLTPGIPVDWAEQRKLLGFQ
jgi:site-specific DNA recombinase